MKKKEINRIIALSMSALLSFMGFAQAPMNMAEVSAAQDAAGVSASDDISAEDEDSASDETILDEALTPDETVSEKTDQGDLSSIEDDTKDGSGNAGESGQNDPDDNGGIRLELNERPVLNDPVGDDESEPVLADQSSFWDSVEYNDENEKHYVILSGYKGTAESIVVPMWINKYADGVNPEDPGAEPEQIYKVYIGMLAGEEGDQAKNLKSVSFEYDEGHSLETACGNIFQGCKALQSVDLKNLDFANTDMGYLGPINDLRYLFAGCESLVSVNINELAMSSVTSISHMFDGCTSITTIDMGEYENDGVQHDYMNTESLKDMSLMFNGCTSLKNLDISGLTTYYVDNMKGMFKDCTSLEKLDMNGIYGGEAEDLSYMFYNCDHLVDLNISSFM